jgi:O-antigen/teichoic acid export membrane protein
MRRATNNILIRITQNTSNQQLVAQIAVLGAPAIYGIAVARWLGPNDRGLYVTLLAASSIAGLIGTLGIATEIRGRVARDLRIPVISSLSKVSVAGAGIGLVGVGILTLNSPSKYSQADLVCMIALSMLTALIILFREMLFGLGVISQTNWVIALTQASQFIPLIFLHSLGELSLINVLAIQVLAQFLMVLLLTTMWRKGNGRRSVQALQSAAFTISPFDRLSLASLLAVQYFAGGDRFILSLFTTPDQVAFYSVGATFALIPGLLVGATIPSVQNASSIGVQQDGRRILWSSIGAVLVSVVIIVLAPWMT